MSKENDKPGGKEGFSFNTYLLYKINQVCEVTKRQNENTTMACKLVVW
jgi:hypothetical protein